MANVLEILLRGKGGDQVKAELGKTNTAVNKTKELMKTLGGIMSVGILAKGFADALKAYEVQELAVTKLNAALKAQGIFTDEASKALQDQASALQQVTTFGDEAIISAQALLLNYGLQKKEVEAAIPTILDFAAATGKDVRAAADYVGRALTGQVSVLRTYGITVDEATLKNKGMAGILETVQDRMGGTAEALAKSGIGPMKQFDLTIGDVKERVAATLLPALVDLIRSIEKWLPFIEKVALGITAVVSTAIEGITTLVNVVQAVTKLRFKEIPKIVKEGGEAVGKIWADTTERMVKIEEKAKEKRVEIVKDETKKKVGMGEFWLKKKEKDEEDARKKEKEEFEKAVGEREGIIRGEYDLRRELRELDLEDVIRNIEERIAREEEGSADRKALEKALSDYKKALQIESAADIAKIQDDIQGNLESNLTDMLMLEKDFGEGIQDVWRNIERVVLQTIVKQVVEEKAAATIRIAAEQAVGAAKAIAAHAGLPFVGIALGVAAAAALISHIGRMSTFQGGGVVPGPEGRPRAILAHGGEEILTPQERRRGRGVYIGTIEIQFPNVTTFQDWIEAPPGRVKEVTERKILQAMSTLEDEGKIKEGTVLI
jgi:hypothetical protein